MCGYNFSENALSALNAMMGSLAERVPVFHLVGVPSHRLQRSHQPLHHSLGDGDLLDFLKSLQQRHA